MNKSTERAIYLCICIFIHAFIDANLGFGLALIVLHMGDMQGKLYTLEKTGEILDLLKEIFTPKSKD